jgi:hypothetical protein
MIDEAEEIAENSAGDISWRHIRRSAEWLLTGERSIHTLGHPSRHAARHRRPGIFGSDGLCRTCTNAFIFAGRSASLLCHRGTGPHGNSATGQGPSNDMHLHSRGQRVMQILSQPVPSFDVTNLVPSYLRYRRDKDLPLRQSRPLRFSVGAKSGETRTCSLVILSPDSRKRGAWWGPQSNATTYVLL